MSQWKGFVVQFAVLLAFWLALSDQFTVLFISMGAVAAALVTAMTHNAVATVLIEPTGAIVRWSRHAFWFVVYVAWILGRIVLASTQVALLVLHPRMPLEPGFVRIRTRLRRPISRTMLANSITLVPGTMTVKVEDDELLVHALVPSAIADLADARTQNMVGRIFGEEPEPAPQIEWEARRIGGGQ